MSILSCSVPLSPPLTKLYRTPVTPHTPNVYPVLFYSPVFTSNPTLPSPVTPHTSNVYPLLFCTPVSTPNPNLPSPVTPHTPNVYPVLFCPPVSTSNPNLPNPVTPHTPNVYPVLFCPPVSTSNPNFTEPCCPTHLKRLSSSVLSPLSPPLSQIYRTLLPHTDIWNPTQTSEIMLMFNFRVNYPSPFDSLTINTS